MDSQLTKMKALENFSWQHPIVKTLTFVRNRLAFLFLTVTERRTFGYFGFFTLTF